MPIAYAGVREEQRCPTAKELRVLLQALRRTPAPITLQVGLALMLLVCAIEVRGGGDSDRSGSKDLLSLGSKEAFRKRRLACLQGPKGSRMTEREKQSLRFPTRPLPRVAHSLPNWATKMLRKVGKLPDILRSSHDNIRQADANLVRSYLAGITSLGAFHALPEALSVHGFLASIVNRVKHGDENIPRTVNPAKDATANARYDSVHSAPQETAVDHDVVNDQCPPKKDAGETFVSFVAHVDNLANVMLVTPDGVRNEWDDIVDEVVNSASSWDDGGDAVATGPTSSPLSGSGAPRTSSAVPTYPPFDDSNTGRTNGYHDRGDEATASEPFTKSEVILLDTLENTTSLGLRTRAVCRSGGGGRPRVSWGSLSGGRSSVIDGRASFGDGDDERHDDGEAARAMAALHEFRREMAAEQQAKEEVNATEPRTTSSSSAPRSMPYVCPPFTPDASLRGNDASCDPTPCIIKSPSKPSHEGLLLDEDGSEVDGGYGDEAHSTEVNGHRVPFVEESEEQKLAMAAKESAAQSHFNGVGAVMNTLLSFSDDDDDFDLGSDDDFIDGEDAIRAMWDRDAEEAEDDNLFKIPAGTDFGALDDDTGDFGALDDDSGDDFDIAYHG